MQLVRHQRITWGIRKADGRGKNSRMLWERGQQPRSPGEHKRLLNSAAKIKQTTPPPKYMCICGVCVCVKTEGRNGCIIFPVRQALTTTSASCQESNLSPILHLYTSVFAFSNLSFLNNFSAQPAFRFFFELISSHWSHTTVSQGSSSHGGGRSFSEPRYLSRQQLSLTSICFRPP